MASHVSILLQGLRDLLAEAEGNASNAAANMDIRGLTRWNEAIGWLQEKHDALSRSTTSSSPAPVSDRVRIICDPDIQFGAPTIRGTRITASCIWERLDAGETVESLLEDLGHISVEDIEAARAFGSVVKEWAEATSREAADAARAETVAQLIRIVRRECAGAYAPKLARTIENKLLAEQLGRTSRKDSDG